MAGAGVLPGGWCWCPSWWLLVSFMVAVGILPAGGGVLPAGVCLQAGGVSAASIFAAGAPGGYARQLLSAAGSLASESKLQGEIDRCDYSYYQLFRCSFWVCFYIAVYRLKY